MADRSVLVVDDFVDGRELLGEYLVWRGFTVLTAASGDEALELARRERPAAILMDLGMPGMDGWTATRLIRRLDSLRHVLIVAVTAHALKPEVDAALVAGCDAVVSKPFDLAAFADALNIALVEGPEAFVTAFSSQATAAPEESRAPERRRPKRTVSRTG